ncbi:MAG: MBL fold metallo-hydrolase, partial [Maritimibacter sp.]|nr:MBL fold metallo-hydrolase [Maritimibacter sp.]
MNITWLGHSGFRIEIEGAVLLVDPWFEGNPMFPGERRAEAVAGATHVLVSHGHGDHATGAPAICRELGIPAVGIFDLMSWWEGHHGIETIGFNKGGTDSPAVGRGDPRERRSAFEDLEHRGLLAEQVGGRAG